MVESTVVFITVQLQALSRDLQVIWGPLLLGKMFPHNMFVPGPVFLRDTPVKTPSFISFHYISIFSLYAAFQCKNLGLIH